MRRREVGREKGEGTRDKGQGGRDLPCKCKQNKPKTPIRTKLGSYPLPDTAQQLLSPAASQVHGGISLPGPPLQALAPTTAQQTLTSHPTCGTLPAPHSVSRRAPQAKKTSA